MRILFALLMLCASLRAQNVTVLVAASAQDAMSEIAGDFTLETGIKVNVSPGASNALAQQIMQGAPADLFLSASEKWTQSVESEGLIAQTRALLGNALVIVQHRDAAALASPADLVHERIKFVALAGENVPAGIYARQALEFHSLYEALSQANKIVHGQDVRSALAFVVRGEADAAIVYASDAVAVGDTVKISFRFAPESHEKIVYPLSLLKQAESNAEALKFFEYLSSPAAMEIFHRFGFVRLFESQNPE